MKTTNTQTTQRSNQPSTERTPGQPHRPEQTRFSTEGEERSMTEQGGGGARQQNSGSEVSGGESQDVRGEVAHEEIARRAHELWEQDGCPDGRSDYHWLEAEKQLRGAAFQNRASESQGGDAREKAREIKASAERRASGQGRN